MLYVNKHIDIENDVSKLMASKNSDTLLSKFPSDLKPRDIQMDILKDIDQKMRSGYKKIIISAPTGSGKSAIAISLANALESSFIVTASKSLQDQYVQDFKSLKSVKGKSNFACFKQMDRAQPKRIRDQSEAIRLKLTCEKGECIEKTIVNGKKKFKNCKYRPAIEDFTSGDDDTVCPYYDQKYTALISPYSIWNYSSYFQLMKFNKKTYARYLDKEVSIFDEAHSIENQMLNFIGFDLTTFQMEGCNIKPNRYNLDDIDDIIAILRIMAEYYATQIQEITESRAYQNNPDYSRVEPLENKFDRIADIRNEILKDTENFVLNTSINQYNSTNVSIIPLDISKYVKDYFITPYQIFMSATISRDSFCETMGIPKDKVAFVDAPYSPFALEHRRISISDIGRLNYKTTAQTEKRLFAAIDEILTNKHPNDRGLILTSSKKWCETILDGLSTRNRSRIRICHATNPNGKTQDEILREHGNTSGSVLLSSSLWEGVDLKDDLSRFQIIAKIPYPNFSEKRTRIKKERYPLWYTSQTLTKMLQGFGRSIRNEKDWAKTYVLDSSIYYLISKSNALIPKAYHDTLNIDGKKQ